METRPGDPKHRDFARGWETLPRGLRQRTLEITSSSPTPRRTSQEMATDECHGP